MIRYKDAIGFKIFQWKNRRTEIWFFPANFRILPHSHPNENIEVLYLFGSTTFYRQSPYKGEVVSWRANFIPRFLSLPFGWNHWFTVGKYPLIAINFSTFCYGCEPTSAAEDLVYSLK